MERIITAFGRELGYGFIILVIVCLYAFNEYDSRAVKYDLKNNIVQACAGKENPQVCADGIIKALKNS
jgi:hypothetical protein